MTGNRRSLASRIRGTRGQAVIITAVSLVALLGLAGIAVDFGYVLNARRQLQASSDAAATAAAQDLSDNLTTAIATATATSYSSVTGNKNAVANLPGVSITVQFSCLAGTGFPLCTNPAGVNAVGVRQAVTLPTFWGRVIGHNSMTVTAKTTALMKGGTMPPLDVIIVLDTTGSMTGTPLANAKGGIRTLLGLLWPCQQGVVTCGGGDPPIDTVGLFVFPGVLNATSVAREYDCLGSPNPVTVDYDASPIYEITPLGNNYRTSSVSGLNPSSNIVDAVEGPGCGSGVEAIGGFGSYFAHAISAAQARLVSSGRASVQNVIIFVSDGDANEYMAGQEPCNEAVAAAQAAKAAGTWVYSIRYYSSNGGGCDDDSGPITSLSTMQQINSDYPLLTAGKFFNQPNNSDLTSTFQKIGQDLLNTRIIE